MQDKATNVDKHLRASDTNRGYKSPDHNYDYVKLNENSYSNEEFFKIDAFQQDFDIQDDYRELKESLKQQVNDELREEKQALRGAGMNKKKMKKRKILKTVGIIFSSLIICTGLLVGTPGGRQLLIKAASSFIYHSMNSNSDDTVTTGNLDDKQILTVTPAPIVDKSLWNGRYEDYVTNYLIFGIEEIGGARNTDSMMIASINTKDNTIKLTSLMRDSYVSIDGYHNNKLNSAYAKGGEKLLVDTIEKNYKIHLDGYAHVNFKSFEEIIDLLGGIQVELGPEEAKYLNRTNYISNKAYRNVHAGVNTLNGNQALGYCRVRKCVTLGGYHDDYGRTLRQRRVLQAVFNKYKSQSILKLLPIMKQCLQKVTTNVSQSQIEASLTAIVENNIRTMDTNRIPYDGMFESPKVYEGVTYPIVLNWDNNIKQMYKDIFGDTDEEAAAELAIQKNK